jgi:hypothetical protein
MKTLLLSLALLLPAVGFAQTYTVDWHKVAGGGGASTNAAWQISGTIGQPDASGPLAGGNYSITGGFWSLVTVVQMEGVPPLTIVRNGPGSVKVLWQAAPIATLQQNTTLTGGSWVTSAYAISTADGTNSITITPPLGNLFFRLKH